MRDFLPRLVAAVFGCLGFLFGMVTAGDGISAMSLPWAIIMGVVMGLWGLVIGHVIAALWRRK